MAARSANAPGVHMTSYLNVLQSLKPSLPDTTATENEQRNING